MNDTVIVVGAGPVGLTMAGELARRDVPVRIIDTLAAPTTQSRAIIVHARSLEMLRRKGVVEQIAAAGVIVTAMEMHTDERLVARMELGIVDSPYPYSVVIAQTETERILTEDLAAHGISVERQVTLVGMEQDSIGVRATVRHAGGDEDVIPAGWLVGADGAHSDVRRLVGTALAGSFVGESFLMGDVHADHDFDPAAMYTFFSAHDGPLLVFPMKGNRMRLIAQIAGHTDRAPTREWLQQIADERATGHIHIREPLWLTTFDIHHAQIPQYRFGRVFLAGDAAHIHSPAGGQGMNTGMQDAFNLGWKLALASQDRASEALLDSYHAERHPVAAHVIQLTTDLTRAGTLSNPIAQRLRNEAMHAATAIAPVRLAFADETEEITLSYRHSPVVVSSRRHGRVAAGDHLPHAHPALDTALAGDAGHTLVTVALDRQVPAAATDIPQYLVADRADPQPGTDPSYGADPSYSYAAIFADPDRKVAHRYGLDQGGRVLVRPDGYVAALTPLDDDAPIGRYQALIAPATAT